MKFVKALAAVVATAALAMGTVAAADAAASKSLTLGVISKPVDFRPSQAEAGNRVWYYQAVYDQLMHETENGTIVPDLATSWTYNATQTVLTLKLRSGVKFSDGTAVDAKAVVASLNAFKAGKGPTANYLDSYKSSAAKGTDTVVITLSDTDPAFLHYLANTAGTIGSAKSTATNPIGSGPYILDTAKSVSGSKYVYKANPTYWDKANRKYDSLTLFVYEDQTALINALRSGTVQGGNVADPAAAATLVSAGLKTSQSYVDAKGIYFDDRSGAHNSCIQSVYVRQAINMVFDRAALSKSLENGTAVPTAQYIPSYNAGYDKSLDALYPYDETKAKALMVKGGYSAGCTITMPTFAPYFGQAVYDIINAQLAKLKITVKETAEAGGTFISNILGNKYDAYLMQFERSGEPWTLINFMLTKNATFNSEGYTNDLVTKLIGDYKAATAAKRPAILKQLNNALTTDAWFDVWYAKQANFVYKGVTIKAPQTGNIIPFLYNIK
jgi:peptide/nickel transport system substrate-binding protein